MTNLHLLNRAALDAWRPAGSIDDLELEGDIEVTELEVEDRVATPRPLWNEDEGDRDDPVDYAYATLDLPRREG